MERARLEALPMSTVVSNPADDGMVRRVAGPSRLARLAGQWDWRLSAHCRLASAASLWAIVFASPFIGLLVGPLLLIRFVTSGVQMALNHRLHGRQPIAKPPLGDWLLLVLAVVGASVAAAIEPGNSVPTNPLLISLALIPFSAVQVRIAIRSYATANRRGEPITLSTRRAPQEAVA